MTVLELFDSSKSNGQDVRGQVLEEVIDAVNRRFPLGTLQQPTEAQRNEVRAFIHDAVLKAYRARGITPQVSLVSSLVEEIARRVMGLGFLDALLPPARTDISEITVTPQGLIAVMPKGSVRWEILDLKVPKEEVWRVLNLLLGTQSKALNEATPIVSAKLPRTEHNPGGGRVHAVHPVVAPGAGYPSINIRLFEQKPVKPEWLLERGLMAPEMMEFLGEVMRRGKRILITGGTRTGKTTLLSALCNFLPRHWRIVKIEDPEEIWIDAPHVVTLEARPVPPGSEVPPVTLADLVDSAMRMSPDYLIVGEVRDGRAAAALFRALMTGHSGSCTFHADNPREAFQRLEAIMEADMGFSATGARRMIASAIDVLVQIGIRHEVRRVTTIAVVQKELKGGSVWFEHVYRYDEDSPPGKPRWEVRKDPETVLREMEELVP